MAYSIFSYGCVIGAVIGTIVYNTEYWVWGLTFSQLFVLVGFVPIIIVVLPSLWNLVELKTSRKISPKFNDIISDVWNTLQLRAVWEPNE